MITSFVGDIFFLGWYFFWPKAKKKILSQQKKNTHQQTKLLIQRKHLYAYDMTFLWPPPPSPTKKYPGMELFSDAFVWIFCVGRLPGFKEFLNLAVYFRHHVKSKYTFDNSEIPIIFNANIILRISLRKRKYRQKQKYLFS